MNYEQVLRNVPINATTPGPLIDLEDNTQSIIAWSICSINAFVMMCSGLVIDIGDLYKNYLRSHIRWPVVVGLFCQMVIMPSLAYAFTPVVNDEAKSFAILVQGTCPGSAILNLFSAWCAGNSKLAQSLTSIGTISAIGLIPLWLYLYSSSYTPIDGNKAIPVPYGPICRTLSILISALFLGIAFRRFSPRIAKKVSKFGTILSILVILTFVVFGELFYEDAWKVDSNMWICVICIPMLGYVIGFIAATIGRLIINVCRKRHIMAPLSGMEYDWAEIRTIGLACGLQNTQFAMSSIFSSFYDEDFVAKMHAYSPMYGVIEMTYAFILAGIYKLLEKKYWKIESKGPRIPNINFAPDSLEYDRNISNEELRKRKLREQKIAATLQRRLPASLYEKIAKAKHDDHDTITGLHQSLHNTLSSILADESLPPEELTSVQMIADGLKELEIRRRSTLQPNEIYSIQQMGRFQVQPTTTSSTQELRARSVTTLESENAGDENVTQVELEHETKTSLWSKLRNYVSWNPDLVKKMNSAQESDDYTETQITQDTFMQSETIHRPDIRTLQTTLSCALEEANNSEADSGAHSGNSKSSSSGSSMEIQYVNGPEDKLEENPSTPSTPASSAASVASFNLAIQGATMAIMRQRHWSHITEFPLETSNNDNPPKSPTSLNLKKNRSDQNLLDDEKTEVQSKSLWTKLKEHVTGNESTGVNKKDFELSPEVREDEDFPSRAQKETPDVSTPRLKKQNSRFSVTPVAVVLPVTENPVVSIPKVPLPEVPKLEVKQPIVNKLEMQKSEITSTESKRPVTRQISRFRVTSISEDPDNLPIVVSPVSNITAETKSSIISPDDVSIVVLEPNQPPDKNRRPSIEFEKSQNIPNIIDQMVSNMQITQISCESDQQPVIKSNEIPNIPVSEVIQSSMLEPSKELSPTDQTSTTLVQPKIQRVSTGTIKVNRFTIHSAETITENEK